VPRGPPPAGHVTIATGRWTSIAVERLGGNQGDSVSIAKFLRTNVLGYRWPAHLTPPPKPVLIAATPIKTVRHG
jgi:hypothetical protein